MPKMKFGQAYCQDLLRRIISKFILYFPSFILFSIDFRILNGFFVILTQKRK
jgi:hypothetical protein